MHSLQNFLDIDEGEMKAETNSNSNTRNLETKQELGIIHTMSERNKWPENAEVQIQGKRSLIDFKSPPSSCEKLFKVREYNSSSNSEHSSDAGVAKVLCPAPRRALQKRMNPRGFGITPYEKIRSARGIGTTVYIYIYI